MIGNLCLSPTKDKNLRQFHKYFMHMPISIILREIWIWTIQLLTFVRCTVFVNKDLKKINKTRPGWASHGNQAGKQCSSMVSSCPAWVPVLTAFSYEHIYGSIRQTNISPSQVALVVLLAEAWNYWELVNEAAWGSCLMRIDLRGISKF